MKYVFMAIAAIIVYPFVILGNVLCMLWHLELNPIVRTECGFTGTGETFEIRAWDGLLGIDKKKRSNFYKA